MLIGVNVSAYYYFSADSEQQEIQREHGGIAVFIGHIIFAVFWPAFVARNMWLGRQQRLWAENLQKMVRGVKVRYDDGDQNEN